MIDFTIEREIAAPIDTVFAKLTDHRAYASMTPMRRSVLEREGDPAPNGVGAIRRLSLVGPPLREQVTAYDAPSHFRYTLLSGLPVRDHHGDVRLEATGGGTRMTYRVTSVPKVPGGTAVLGTVIKQAVTQLVNGVQQAAEGAR